MGEPHNAGEPAWTPPPDWPAMVQKVTVARLHLRDYRDVQDPIFSGYWLFRRRFAAEEMFGYNKRAIALILAADAVA